MYKIKNGNYYLSTHYSEAAEAVLGYGGIWAKTDIRLFYTKKEAELLIKKIKRITGLKDLEVVKA